MVHKNTVQAVLRPWPSGRSKAATARCEQEKEMVVCLPLGMRRERDVGLAPHCGGGTGVTVPGLGAVGSGGRGVPGSVERRKLHQLR